MTKNESFYDTYSQLNFITRRVLGHICELLEFLIVSLPPYTLVHYEDAESSCFERVLLIEHICYGACNIVSRRLSYSL